MDKIAVVILNYLNYGDTQECVESLLKLEKVRDYVKGIVIVDNHSSNESFEALHQKYAENAFVDLIRTERNLGFAGGNNAGISRARKRFQTDFVLVVNNDTLFGDSAPAFMPPNILGGGYLRR